jgi:hypothetical protein
MQAKKDREFGLYFWLHAVALLLAYASPLLVSWKVIMLGVVILEVQYRVLHGCFLTHLEFGKNANEVFLWYYVRKIFPSLRPQATKVFVRVLAPIFLVAFSFVIQSFYHFEPILSRVL